MQLKTKFKKWEKMFLKTQSQRPLKMFNAGNQ